MSKEYILDLGIGSGGKYIHDKMRPHETRIGVDLFEFNLQYLQENYPQVIPVLASGKKLPFPNNIFKKIEIYLPYNTLLLPGLQHNAGTTTASTNPIDADKTYYSEFARVLKPAACMTILGDDLVHPEEVKTQSALYFDLISVKKITQHDLESLGTYTAEALLNKNAQHGKAFIKKWLNKCHIIELKSKKTE